MDLLRYSPSTFPTHHRHRHCHLPHHSPHRQCFSIVRSNLSLPFTNEKAKYYKELEAAFDVVQRACRLCVDVKKSLLTSNGRILEKNDRTPVTIADFGVQALVSLELNNLFPTIPLVAEEDSAFLRINNLGGAVTKVVTKKAINGDKLSEDDVLKAIDRGGKDAYVFTDKPATYWVLDPIDGTRGFVKGTKALYVVGLALVVEGKIVLGVMGCPNWEEDKYTLEQENTDSESGAIMVSHIDCGTWRTSLRKRESTNATSSHSWMRCFVDQIHLVNEGRFCSPDSQTWDSLPLSDFFSATTYLEKVEDKQILLLPSCCGSLCKYMMVASGQASVFIQRAKSEKTIKAWDHAVGVICVREAGGKVSDWEGNELEFSGDEDERRIIYPLGGVLVTNNMLHSEILELISLSSSSVV